jgi:pseudouridine-5'-phosphate glycosidase
VRTQPTILTPEVTQALADGTPVVALESTIISHGLPRPENLRVARAVEATVRERGAVPATIAVVDGRVHVGLDDSDLQQVAERDDVVKASVRDLATVVSSGGTGATTVAATSHIAAQAGVKVFATGGLGGVHRHARDSWDESADLTTLATTRITVVCAGVKSILDVAATLERLETLNIAVLGYRTTRFPGFYLTDSGYTVETQVNSPDDIATNMHARDALNIPSALIVAKPLPETEQLDPDLHDAVLEQGLALASRSSISGKDVTPFLLDYFHRTTHGLSMEVNERIILSNAALAADIAVSYAQQ